jgi:hypothetical protein
VASQQPAPVPPQPPKPSQLEAATATAELEIVLLPKEVRTKATSGVIVSNEQSKLLIEAIEGLGHAVLAVFLVLGTLYLAPSVHLNSIMTWSLILVELMTSLGIALMRRSFHRG